MISIALPGANLVYGGLMGQGKSNAARVTVIGAALDPLAELWVFVFANNGDFDAYRPRLARYHRGVDDHVAAAALDGLRELYEMVGRREARLAELGAKKVTRALAEQHPELRPLMALFSECHELFGHPGYGREAADLAVQTMRRGRKTAISLGFDTQSSRADAIPPKIVELVKVNACFAVKASSCWCSHGTRRGSDSPRRSLVKTSVGRWRLRSRMATSWPMLIAHDHVAPLTCQFILAAMAALQALLARRSSSPPARPQRRLEA